MFIYDTGRCPKCNSTYTGRVLPYFLGDTIKESIKHLKKCDPVIFSPRYKEFNCFCIDCNAMWYGDIDLKWVPRSDAQRYIEELGGTEEFFEEYDNNTRRRREEIRKNRETHTQLKKNTKLVLNFFVHSELNPFKSLVNDFSYMLTKKEIFKDKEPDKDPSDDNFDYDKLAETYNKIDR